MSDLYGIRLATSAAGIKSNATADCLLVALPPDSQTAAVFTQNHYVAAPVIVSKEHLATNEGTRYLLVNSGNANCGLGQAGLEVARQSAAKIAALSGCQQKQVLLFSTGVINSALAWQNLEQGISDCMLSLGSANLKQAAEAIMTTDTQPKFASKTVTVDGEIMHLSGISKGSGMICPNMATMLGFMFSDVRLSKELTDRALKTAVEQSFNCISVDGDTSTNDSCTLTTTSKGVYIDSVDSKFWQPWLEALCALSQELAKAIIKDGEGATKLIEIQVNGGQSVEDCRKAAFTIAHSPLVKTAFFAEDANIGRIAAALGRCGVANLDFSKVNIALGNIPILTNGALPNNYNETLVDKVIQKDSFVLSVDLSQGTAKTTVWTCDLSHEYVRINAEYRT